MKIYYIITSLLFFVFAYVQINDPDPWLWVGWYVFLGILSALAAAGRYYRSLVLVGLGLCALGVLRLFPDFVQWVNDGMPNIAASMKAESPYIELVREFLGLVISTAALVVLYLRGRKMVG